MVNISPWRRSYDLDDAPSAITRLRANVDRLFDRFFEPWPGSETAPGAAWMPAVDVQDRENEILIAAELPGVNPDDIELSVSGNTLSISGERKEESEEKHGGYFTRERHYGSFSRTLTLPMEADLDRISAEYRDGDLIVHVPKSEAQRPKRIPIGKTSAQAAGESKPVATTQGRVRG